MYRKIYIVVLFLLISMITGCESDTNQVNLSTGSDDKVETEITRKPDAWIYVYIHGQVNHPGVYHVKSGERLYTIVEKAGGFTKKAVKDELNLAEAVTDGQDVYVMSKKEYQKKLKGNRQKESFPTSDVASSGQNEERLININTATKDELMTLSGIGQSKALAIIEYREKNGDFTKTTDIKNVSGIGDATFLNIESMITVG